MILSNVEILKAIERGDFNITPLAGKDPTRAPFNTSAVDLRLGPQINVFKSDGVPVNFDLRKPGLANFLHMHSEKHSISANRPYALNKGDFILGQTMERVSFPLLKGPKCYSARVEGKSSLARCGIIVHFTAPTIHAGFSGPITLEIINLGPITFMLYPEMFFCQLIIEEVCGTPAESPNQFSGQVSPSGAKE
jgi:dCTP deaminase